MHSLEIHTRNRSELRAVTSQLAALVAAQGWRSGALLVYCPHTTAGLTVNENADPDVVRDFLVGLEAAFPDHPSFRHREGHSPAHLKSSCVGVSETVIVRNGRPFLGTWKGIYLCEFDGPRSLRFQVRVLKLAKAFEEFS